MKLRPEYNDIKERTVFCSSFLLYISIKFSDYCKLNYNLSSASTRKSGGKVGYFGKNGCPNYRMINR